MVNTVTAAALAGRTPRAALQRVQAALRSAACPDADYDAFELLRSVTGRDPRLPAVQEIPLTAAQAEKLAAYTNRRAAREPLQYILGEWDFLDFTLKVGPGVLCPRADSEVVCEKAIALLRGLSVPRVLDLCAGTGCLGIGIRRFVPGAQVVCTEKDEAAYHYLAYNAANALQAFGIKQAVSPQQADVFTYWQDLAPGSMDLIISNPPYLTAAEMDALMPETRREPAMALAGGADGLDFYRCLLQNYKRVLRPGGWLVLEIGCEQGSAVQKLAAEAGWCGIGCGKDYGGNDRVVAARRP